MSSVKDSTEIELPKCSGAGAKLLLGLRDFCKETSIHGFTHIAAPRRHWLERLLWFGITAAAIWGAVDVSLGQWQRYNENPTVITLDKDFRSWRFPLPGLTLCEKNRADPKKLPGVIKNTWNISPDDDKYEYYKKFVEVVANSNLFELQQFQMYAEDTSLNVDLFQLAVDVNPEFKVKTTWVDSVTMRWIPVMTEVGMCYATNSLALLDIALIKLDTNETSSTTVVPVTCTFSSFACYVIMEMTSPFYVYVHSPHDVADVITPPMTTVILTLNKKSELGVTESLCGPGVRELAVKRRRCLYVDEPSSENMKVYSENMCRRTCRNALAVQYCGCKPFYNFYEEGKPCNPAGMWCLAKLAQKLASLKCSCALQCNDAEFQELSFEEQFWDRGPFVNQGSLKYTLQPPRARYSKEIVFQFQDLVVSFGGAAGLFLGASFLSFVEIFYIFFEKILYGTCLRNNRSKPIFYQGSDVDFLAKDKRIYTYEEERIQKINRILEDPHGIGRSEFRNMV